ncbi:MAG TPA: hypothetical protein VJR94_01735 [Candidatus Nitrosocosmicus sp.]|nr:hypothetical protein [Candidatus Nitrosocosmicus sp.]
MIELLIFSSSAGLGIICAIFLYRFISNKKHDEHVVLGNVKYELNNLYFEKSVALEALGKIKQFFEDKKIDEYERDRLSRKYVKMLENYNKRVFQLNPILEAQEIYEYKKQLDSILAEYTKRIDSRLANITGYPAVDKKRAKVITAKRGTTEYGASSESATIASSSSSSSSSTLKSVSAEPAAELQASAGVRHSPRSLAQQIKSSLMRISPVKINEDKNNGLFAESYKGIDSVPSLDEEKSGQSNSTYNTTSSNIKDEGEDQALSEIEPNLVSLPTEDNNMQSNDSDKTEEINIDTKEIDKIQSDILKTLKRLEDS